MEFVQAIIQKLVAYLVNRKMKKDSSKEFVAYIIQGYSKNKEDNKYKDLCFTPS